MTNQSDTKACERWQRIDLADLYIAALRQMRDQGLLITFFQLPKHIRKLIIQSLEARHSSLRQAYQAASFKSIHWTYREQVETYDYELEIEQHLLNISRDYDLGAFIFINRRALQKTNDEFHLIEEFDNPETTK